MKSPVCDVVLPWQITPTENITGEESFSLYPNPSNGQIVVETPNNQLNVRYLRIVDVSGRVVCEHLLGAPSATIDLKLPAGLYFYSCYTPEGVIAQGKLLLLDP